MALGVYILLCSDETFYIGVTNDIEKRLAQHQSAYNKDSYTASRLPVKLVWGNYFQSKLEAISWEKRIKNWSKAKKLALINGEYDHLPGLAECRNETHYKNYRSRLRSN